MTKPTPQAQAKLTHPEAENTAMRQSLQELHQQERKTDATLCSKYPEHKWHCYGNYVEGSATRNRRKHWINSNPVNSHYQAIIGIDGWKLATAEGESHEEAIERVVLRMRQLLKDVEGLFNRD
jgi:predicted phosphohydrolase